MSNAYSDSDGEFLVRLARRTVEEFVQTHTRPTPPADTPPHLMRECGVFVTLNSIKDRYVSLRGCIGRPYPTERLIDATINSAIDAAVNDTRFPPVRVNELDRIVVELSVLTEPKKLEYSDPKELLNLVQIGRDGLIVSRGPIRGLLLPQVPVEWKWDTKEFLQHTCNKAGLPSNAWLDLRTEFFAFQAEIFGELTPRGKIVRNPEHLRVE